jgi:hypothetical protein
MSDGAGTGPGLKGDGSQNAGEGTSTGDAKPGSGSVTVTGTPSSSDNAAGMNAGPVEKTPFVIAGLVVALSLTGTLLL